SRRDLLVRRVFRPAAGVPYRDRYHAIKFLERRLHTPETSAREGRLGQLFTFRRRGFSGHGDRRESDASEESQRQQRGDPNFHSYVLNAGSGSSVGTKLRATPLLHQRWPVGGGPSSNTCP